MSLNGQRWLQGFDLQYHSDQEHMAAGALVIT
jgi:hypothetical protein